MKKFLLLLFAFGMFTCAFAQKKVSDEVLELSTRPQRLMIDMDGNGLTLDSTIETSILNGKKTLFPWTRFGTDDAFLVISSILLQSFPVSGYNKHVTIYDNEGHDLGAISSYICFQNGLSVKLTNIATPIKTISGWQMLRLFDENGDGRIDNTDRIWLALNIYIDSNADGVISTPGTNSVPPYDHCYHLYDKGVKFISLTTISPNVYDAAGNLRINGTLHYKDGKKGLVSNIYFKEIEPIKGKDTKIEIKGGNQ